LVELLRVLGRMLRFGFDQAYALPCGELAFMQAKDS
jgi:hypothetical protein